MNILQYININWFINKKPYKTATGHDLFLLKLCRDLFPVIKRTAEKYEIAVEDIDCRELAFVYTSYFEDVTSDIGFWKVVVEKHHALYGKRVPFLTDDFIGEGEYVDIFPADIYYLSLVYFAFLSKISNVRVYPDHLFIEELSQEVFVYLDTIEEFSVTDFYKTYLMPGEDYGQFRNKLQWFALRGYLFGFEFEFRLEELRYPLEPRIKQQGGSEQDYNNMVYTLLDDLCFNALGGLSALSPLTVLATSMANDEQVLKHLLQLHKRIHGVFEITDQDEQYLWLAHIHDKKSYAVLKSSLPNATDLGTSFPYCKTTLTKWKEEYRITGICVFLREYGGEEKEEDINSYLKHDVTYQEKRRNDAVLQQQEAESYFGSPFFICKDNKEVVDKMNGLFALQNRKRKAAGQKDIVKLKDQDLPEAKDVAVCFTKKGRYCIVPNVSEIKRILKAGGRDAEDAIQLAWCLAEESIDADFWELLRGHMGKEWPDQLFQGIPIKEAKDLQALLRIYKPQDF